MSTYAQGMRDGEKYAQENPKATEEEDQARFATLPGKPYLSIRDEYWEYRQGFYAACKIERNAQLLRGERDN